MIALIVQPRGSKLRTTFSSVRPSQTWDGIKVQVLRETAASVRDKLKINPTTRVHIKHIDKWEDLLPSADAVPLHSGWGNLDPEVE